MSEEEKLEQQIGDFGDEPRTSLGQLNHIPGKQEKLTEEEQSSLDAFKSATSKMHNQNIITYTGGDYGKSNDIREGWIPIDRGMLGTRSQFYPLDWEFRIKAASTEAIKNWSSIEEETSATINNVVNEILKTCVSIYSPIRGSISWEKINSWDKFWFILRVREYTFENGETALEFDEDCDSCGHPLHYKLESSSLYYEFPDNEVVERHWNQEKMVWEINPRDFGVESHPVRLYCPTVGKDQAIINWLVEKSQLGKVIDETFIKFLPYMLETAPKDPHMLDRKIKDCQNEFKSWSLDMFLFMDEVRKNITINPSEKLSQTCPNCGEEVRSTVQFPNGVKYLFAIQGRHKKFGSK